MAHKVTEHFCSARNRTIPEYWQPDCFTQEMQFKSKKLAEAYEKRYLIHIAKEKIDELNQPEMR